MNLNTENLSINPCVVCGYLFSDAHHIWPQAKGGKNLTTIALCPNHHRFANIVQAMMMQERPHDDIRAFAREHFDPTFNHLVLDYLIDEQQRISWRGWHLFFFNRLQSALAAEDMAAAMQAVIGALNALADGPLPARPRPPRSADVSAHTAYTAALEAYVAAIERRYGVRA